MSMILAVIAVLSPASGATVALPADVARQLPPGYQVLSSARVDAGAPMRHFEIVAIGRSDEGKPRGGQRNAPTRPLLIFELQGGHFFLADRNDHIVLKADEGGQCDPFLDGDATIAVKGRYFTVQNGVACGAHWTDYVTFRLDDRAARFVFDNERQEAWELNPSNDPNAEALVQAGPARLLRDRPGNITAFAAWRPKR